MKNLMTFFRLLVVEHFQALIIPNLTVVNLTLIDLPGLTKVAVGKFHAYYLNIQDVLFSVISYLEKLTNLYGFPEGQPDSIVGDIENMVRSFIEKVILFLLSSNLLTLNAQTFLIRKYLSALMFTI